MTNYEATKFELKQASEEQATFSRWQREEENARALAKAREAVAKNPVSIYHAYECIERGWCDDYFVENFPKFAEIIENASEVEKNALGDVLARKIAECEGEE